MYAEPRFMTMMTMVVMITII